MSDNRSQMVDSLGDEQPWRKNLPEWWERTPPEYRSLRRQNPYWTMWIEMDKKHGILEKNRQDLMEDALGATDDGREKSATAAEVSRLEQSRAKGQRFERTDARPRTTRISTAIQSGGDDHEFLDSPDDWNALRRI